MRSATLDRLHEMLLTGQNRRDVLRGLLATGRFLTMFPDSLVRYGPERVAIRILPIKLPRWHVPTSAVTLKDRTLSPIAQHFIDCLRELARPLEKAPGPIRAAAGSGPK